MTFARIGLVGTLLAVPCLTGCDDGAERPAMMDEDPRLVRPRANPIEFVGMRIEKRVTTAQVLAFLGPLFGEEASEGTLHTGFELQPGLLLTVEPDPRTNDQRIVRLDMETSRDASPARRTILRVPVSLTSGDVYTTTVRTALAQMEGEPDGGRPFNLDYRVWSPQGGSLTLSTIWEDGQARLSIRTENPRTSLQAGEINSPAFIGEPFETIGGTVWFGLSRDEFDFFSKRAYGTTAGSDQNFQDFRLQPHDWLRLTVTPLPEQEMVDVAFEVVTDDGRRVPLTRAPASYVAGDQFRENVFRLLDNMLAQEAEEAGSSDPFEAPFHYDDPEGGGVVKVIAQGEAGQFRIAYTVESPIQRLRDVDFVEYVGDVVPDRPDPTVVDRDICVEAGSVRAEEGTFVVTFDASPTVRESDRLEHPLRGDVVGSVYRAEDVTIGGPNEGAEAVGDFLFEDVDITDPDNLQAYELDFTLPAGEYQLLGFMDINGNRAETGDDPEPGEPVVLPIGDFELQCARQPVTMEFALLLPEGF